MQIEIPPVGPIKPPSGVWADYAFYRWESTYWPLWESGGPWAAIEATCRIQVPPEDRIPWTPMYPHMRVPYWYSKFAMAIPAGERAVQTALFYRLLTQADIPQYWDYFLHFEYTGPDTPAIAYGLGTVFQFWIPGTTIWFRLQDHGLIYGKIPVPPVPPEPPPPQPPPEDWEEEPPKSNLFPFLLIAAGVAAAFGIIIPKK